MSGGARNLLFLFCAGVVGCSQEKATGPIEMQIIRPTGARCGYTIDYAPVRTLESIDEMRGLLGQVVTSGDNVESRPEMLDQGVGFHPVDVQFSSSGNQYSPLDYNSLYAASLYYSIEQGYLLFSRLDPSADVTRIVPNIRETRIVHEARRTFSEGGPEVFDNAEYLPHRRVDNPQAPVMNYFFSFPTDQVEDIPLGLNVGIMVHEFSHEVSHHLFYEPAIRNNLLVKQDGKPTENTLAALDEGFADYFGFLATKDPGYFDCSYPGSGRDISQPRAFDAAIYQNMTSGENFDPHEGGAVFASINYEIGRTVGFEEHGKSLIRLIQALPTCTSSGGALSADFGTIARCHIGVIDSRYQSIAQQVYGTYLGPYGGSR